MFEQKDIEELKKNIDLSKLNEIAKISAQIGNEILKNNYNKIQKISSKGRKGDLVTNVDLEVENKIKEFLEEVTPEISINAEESGKSIKSSNLIWCIDPLDGTTNYSHGYPFFATSIGLVYKNVPILGAISVPYLNELYSACIGEGSYCNDILLKVSRPAKLSDCLLVTGFSYDRFETEDNNYAEFCYLTHKTRGVRRGGAAAVDLAFVAAGKLDGYWERGLEVWDLAAGAIIVKEAGGIISDYPSGEFNLSSGRILACSPSLENELKNELDKVSPFKKNLYT
ncbi:MULTISPECIES: inositol monophosphatase family protein [Prochlorococcus]|uniref:Inositol-1-monophosphatase n=1 Tax=Prochlorococcus marinus str. MIT 9116 TaxID=167544 RepID=A0A0A1ZLD1_PROMR|nr:inositol monophosphatase family protein [Prochlorococcus marinus]KGF89584.1 Inositol-1-monophosphatasee [Prochlorococcus marinus str. MIT 9107]KGF90407.1 Inositol-1-monophosphatasee [Prochlorococcus marinus str. MIT 9116]KGF92886.1 Inositol-1-monophosphatasee [Prochlorococcus marinus str. MIT 9123]